MDWTVSNLDRTLPEGVVQTVHWRVSKVDGAHSGSVYATVALPPKDPADPGFIPYADLTEADAVQWVKDALGADAVAAAEAAVDAQIEAKKNPITGAGVPWA